MDSAESSVPAPSLDLTARLIALAILVSFLLPLAALHFLLKKLNSRIHPSIPLTAQVYHGVDEEVLSSMPVHSYSKDHKFLYSKYQHECSVCLSGLEEGESVPVLPHCCHVFHVQCIDAWFAAHTTCPFCRLAITAAEPFMVPVEVNDESNWIKIVGITDAILLYAVLF